MFEFKSSEIYEYRKIFNDVLLGLACHGLPKGGAGNGAYTRCRGSIWSFVEGWC